MRTLVVDTLSRLVAFPTVSNRPVTEIAAFLAQVHEDQGFRIERFDAPEEAGKLNLVASIGPTEPGGLVLSGHMDVVPTEDQPWSTDPFCVAQRAGRLYGRGTADMKGFIAATVHALARIRPAEFRRELVLVWTHDEEVGCTGSAELARTWEAEGRTLPEACLVGEPTEFRILRAHPGHVDVEVQFTGRAAHSSRPDLGANAIAAAAEAISLVGEFAAELEQERAHEELLERPWVTMNVATVRGGRAINIVPDHCVVEIGYRPLPGMPPEQVFQRISDLLAKRWGARSEVRATARLTRVTPSLLTPAGTPLQAVLEPHAVTPRIGAASYATDGGNLARLGARPLIFGPGSIEAAHGADEYIERADLERAVDVVEEIARAMCCS
jgi:acetylornithine deacetylase